MHKFIYFNYNLYTHTCQGVKCKQKAPDDNVVGEKDSCL